MHPPCPTITGTVGGGGSVCSSGGSSTVTVTLRGGTGPYTVTLNNGGGTQTGAGPLTFTVSLAATTTYSVQSGMDSLGCAMTGSGSATVTVISCTELSSIFVADTSNRIQRFMGGSWAVLGSAGPGAGLGQFTLPEAVTSDVTGMKIYVADTGNNRLLRFNGGVPGTATLLATAGTAPGFVNNPRGLAVDASNTLYEADFSTNRIQKFVNANAIPTASVVAGPGSALSPGQVLHPEGVAVSNGGNLYVADAGNQRVLLFPGGTPGTATLVCGTGMALGQVKVAEGVTVVQGAVLGGAPGSSALIISDSGNNRIQGSLMPITPGVVF